MKKFYSKKGFVYVDICRYLLMVNENERLISISKMAEKFNVGRGTIQNVINELVHDNVIVLKKLGRQGTVLISKDSHKILTLIDKKNFYGVLPLPYTLRYEGLSTGLKKILRKQLNSEISFSFVKTADTRVKMLIENRIDFGVFSEAHAKKIISLNKSLEKLVSFGDYTYISKHVVVSTTKNIKVVGVDANSYVHRLLIEDRFKSVEIKQVEYNNLKKYLEKGLIDATVLNLDHIENEEYFIEEIDEDKSYSRACILINKENEYIKSLINFDCFVDDVVKIQRLVLENKVEPSY